MAEPTLKIQGIRYILTMDPERRIILDVTIITFSSILALAAPFFGADFAGVGGCFENYGMALHAGIDTGAKGILTRVLLEISGLLTDNDQRSGTYR
mgnify:CR=1 FL=1